MSLVSNSAESGIIEQVKHQLDQSQSFSSQLEGVQALLNQLGELFLAETKPEPPIVCKILGNIFQSLGSQESAQNWYIKAVELKPDFAHALANLGTIYAMQQQWEKAISCYQKAIAILPCGGFYRNLAKIFSQNNNQADTCECLYIALMLEPNTGTAEDYLTLGSALLDLQKREQAMICLQRAVYLKPNCTEAHKKIGDIALSQGRQEDAIASYQKTLEIEPYLSEVRQKLGRILGQSAETQSPNAANKQVESRKEKQFWSEYNLAQNLLEQEKLVDALEAYHNAIALKPDFAWSYYNLGDTLLKLERWEESAAAYRKSCELNPDFFGSYHQLGDALLKLERWEAAAAAYHNSCKLNPDFFWSHYNLGQLWENLERWEEAIPPLRQAMRLDSDNAQCYYHLIKVLLKAGQDRLVIDYYRPELEFEEAKMYYGLGEVFAKVGQVEDAIACYRRALILA